MYLFLPTLRLRNRLKQMTFSLLNRRRQDYDLPRAQGVPTVFRVGTIRGTLRVSDRSNRYWCRFDSDRPLH